MFEFGKDALNAIKEIRALFTRFFIDGGLTVAIAEQHARYSNHMDISIVRKENSEMKQLKQTEVKQPQVMAVQDTKKVQTFMWTLNGNVKEVCLAGDFNKWKPEPMAKCENGFRATVKLEPGVYQYKFVVDGVWKVDPAGKGIAQNDFGTSNSVLLVD